MDRGFPQEPDESCEGQRRGIFFSTSAEQNTTWTVIINDRPDNLRSDSFLFEDDTKILRHITSAQNGVILQCDLKSLEKWSKTLILQFNVDKCHIQTLGKIENIVHNHRYQRYDEELEHVLEETDLRVTIDQELKFEDNISRKASKSTQLSV